MKTDTLSVASLPFPARLVPTQLLDSVSLVDNYLHKPQSILEGYIVLELRRRKHTLVPKESVTSNDPRGRHGVITSTHLSGQKVTKVICHGQRFLFICMEARVLPIDIASMLEAVSHRMDSQPVVKVE